MSLLGMDIAARALMADQTQMDVISQNIANVSTPGYSRQIAVLEPVAGVGDGSGDPLAPGGGVDVALVSRAHASWLDGTAAALNAQSGQTAMAQQQLGGVENLLAEPTPNGLQAALDGFYSAFSTLSSQPSDTSARQAVVAAGEAVAGKFQQLTDGLTALEQQTQSQAGQNVATVNSLTSQIAGLDQQITQAQQAGGTANELMDQRDQLLQQVTAITGATVTGQAGGELVVSIGGTEIVQGGVAQTVSASGPPGQFQLSVGGSQITAIGGQLRAQQDFLNNTAPQYSSQIAAIRDQFASAVNSASQSGVDLNGAAGIPFFTADSAGNISVNQALVSDPTKVVAGNGAPGDGSVAAAIAAQESASGSAASVYQSFVAQVGTASSNVQNQAQQAQSSLQQVQQEQASQTGVNLDEELANMVTTQHAYAASAKVLSTYDSLLQTLVSMGTG